MKKCLLLIALAVPFTLSGQNAWDAFRYSRTDYHGTARSMALGNAMTALGGDFGSITLNPAASAIYPYSELSITPLLTNQFSDVQYFGHLTGDRYTRAGLSSVGYVGSWKTSGPVSLSFAAGYNRVQDFTLRTSVRRNDAESSWLTPVATMTDGIQYTDLESTDDYNPFYDSNASWRSILAWNAYLLDPLPGTDNQYIAATENLNGEEISVGGSLNQRFTKESRGSMGEYLLNMGANINNRVFVGYSLNFRNVYYRTYEKFSETSQDPSLFDTHFQVFPYLRSDYYRDRIQYEIGGHCHSRQQSETGTEHHFTHRTSLTDKWQEQMTASFWKAMKV